MKTDYAVFGIYKTQSEIDKAVSWLKSLGCNLKQVSATYPDHTGAQDFSYVIGTRIPQYALWGGVMGSFLGALAGLFMATGWIPVPGLGHLTPMGSSLGFILGIVFGIIAGAACGTLVGIGVPQSVGRRYKSYIDDGGILLSVHLNADDEATPTGALFPDPETKQVSADVLQKVLEMTGGQDVTVTKEDSTWKEIVKDGPLSSHSAISHQ